METKHEFKLTFATNKGADLVITVPRADENKTISDLQAAMNGVIITNIVHAASGEPVSMGHAELLTTEIRNYAVA